MQPTLQDVQEALADVIAQSLKVIGIPERVFTHEELAAYVMAESDDAEGEWVSDPYAIVIHYLGSWFVVDFVSMNAAESSRGPGASAAPEDAAAPQERSGSPRAAGGRARRLPSGRRRAAARRRRRAADGRVGAGRRAREGRGALAPAAVAAAPRRCDDIRE